MGRRSSRPRAPEWAASAPRTDDEPQGATVMDVVAATTASYERSSAWAAQDPIPATTVLDSLASLLRAGGTYDRPGSGRATAGARMVAVHDRAWQATKAKLFQAAAGSVVVAGAALHATGGLRVWASTPGRLPLLAVGTAAMCVSLAASAHAEYTAYKQARRGYEGTRAPQQPIPPGYQVAWWRQEWSVLINLPPAPAPVAAVLDAPPPSDTGPQSSDAAAPSEHAQRGAFVGL